MSIKTKRVPVETVAKIVTCDGPGCPATIGYDVYKELVIESWYVLRPSNYIPSDNGDWHFHSVDCIQAWCEKYYRDAKQAYAQQIGG